MSEREIRDKKKVFISYLEDNGEKVEGYVNSVETKEGWVIIDNGKNIISIPSHRVLKIKEGRE